MSKELKQVACKEIEKHADQLKDLNRYIWENPELNFQEVKAHDFLTDFLEQRGFDVERRYKLDTAFRAVYGQDGTGPHVVVCCEYDALPEIDHACGHNLIAEAGVAAGLGVKAALESSGIKGKLTVLGTPAEESGGGKIDLIKAKVFDGVDFAMMVHPSCFSSAAPSMLSADVIKYIGKAAHAAAFPFDGVNALDAAFVFYQSLACLRQQLRPTLKVGVILMNGGVKTNIIPSETEIDVRFWASRNSGLPALRTKLTGCIEAGAKATGCQVEYSFGQKGYSNMMSNKPLARTYEMNAKACGMIFTPEEKIQSAGGMSGGTDMGDVSHVIPSIHPKFYICDPVQHTREFATAARTEEAHLATLDSAKAMAMTVIDVFNSPELLAQIKQDFRESQKEQ